MSVKKWNATKQEAENIVGSQIEAKEIYSTSEVKTNKVWIDGKPIYRQVIVIENPNTSWDKENKINIANINHFRKVSVEAVRTADSSIISEYYNNATDLFGCLLIKYVDKNYLTCYLRGTATIKTVYVTVEYTKTTD